MADAANDDIIDDTTAVNPTADVEMTESGATEDGAADQTELPFAGEDTVVEPEPARVPFVDYLTSPVVTLIVGKDNDETILTAHQALLTISPHFKALCDNFTDDGSVSSTAPFHQPPMRQQGRRLIRLPANLVSIP